MTLLPSKLRVAHIPKYAQLGSKEGVFGGAVGRVVMTGEKAPGQD